MKPSRTNVVFTAHAKQRAYERLNIKHDRMSLLFETELNNIFKKARRMYHTDDGKIQYEAVHNGKVVKFICNEESSKIVVNTVIVN